MLDGVAMAYFGPLDGLFVILAVDAFGRGRLVKFGRRSRMILINKPLAFENSGLFLEISTLGDRLADVLLS